MSNGRRNTESTFRISQDVASLVVFIVKITNRNQQA